MLGCPHPGPGQCPAYLHIRFRETTPTTVPLIGDSHMQGGSLQLLDDSSPLPGSVLPLSLLFEPPFLQLYPPLNMLPLHTHAGLTFSNFGPVCMAFSLAYSSLFFSINCNPPHIRMAETWDYSGSW